MSNVQGPVVWLALVRACAHTSQRLKPVVRARLGAELVQQPRTEAGQVGAAAAQHEVGGHGGAHVARALEERAGAQSTREAQTLTKTDGKKRKRLCWRCVAK